MAMRCTVARRQMDALLDGLLSGPRAERLRTHVQQCPDCGAEFAARRDMLAALRALPAEPLPEGFEHRLHRRLAAVVPQPERRRWWGVVLPAATAAAGFLAAATVAAPLVSPGGSAAPTAHALATAGASAPGGAAHQVRPVPIQQAGPSLDRKDSSAETYAAADASTSVINGGAATVYGVQDQPAAAQAGAKPALARSAQDANSVAGDGPVATTVAPSSATDPAALSLTILAPEPMKAVADLSQLAAAGGGHVIATFPAHPDDQGLQNAPQPVATLDALIPASAADAYARRAAADGRVLASVSSLPPATAGAEANVRLLVTVLAPPAAPPPAPSAAPPSGPAWSRTLVLAAARSAPWAAGIFGAGVLGWAASRLRRRP